MNVQNNIFQRISRTVNGHHSASAARNTWFRFAGIILAVAIIGLAVTLVATAVVAENAVVKTPLITLQPKDQSVAAGTGTSFGALASGKPEPAVQWQVSRDNGKTWQAMTGETSPILSFVAQSSDNGSLYRAVFTNQGYTKITQTVVLTIATRPQIIVSGEAAFTANEGSSFEIRGTGSPLPVLTLSGALPSGLQFIGAEDGSGKISGTPTSGSGGVYQLNITAQNGSGSIITQPLTLTVYQAATLKNLDSPMFTAGSANNVTITSYGYPAPSISLSGQLPGGITFVDNGNGSAEISGTPQRGTGKGYTITILAHNGIGQDAETHLTLWVNETPSFTSINNTVFVPGAANTFTVTTIGFPVPAISESGALPAGITFIDHKDGTAGIIGTVSSAQSGIYKLLLSISNGNDANEVQPFVLTIGLPPSIAAQPASETVCATGTASFSIQVNGLPAPVVQWQVSSDNGHIWSDIPGENGLNYTFNSTTDNNNLQYRAVLSNVLGSITTQAASLTVDTLPTVTTNPTSISTTARQPIVFKITANGSPSPVVQWQVSDDGGTTWTNLSGANNSTLSITPNANDTGKQFRANLSNACGSAASTAALLTVKQIVPVITWTLPGSLVYGTALGPAQLNAKASVPGSFSYDPSSGVVLNAGSGQALELVFTPTDNINYNQVQARQTINITPAPLEIKVEDRTRQYSDPTPPFSVTYTGFVNRETPKVLSGSLSCSSTADANSASGNYPITCTGLTSRNYSIHFTPGTLVIALEDASIRYTGDNVAKVGDTLNLSATAWDSAAKDFPETGNDAGQDTTIGDISHMWIAFDVFQTADCDFGAPFTTLIAQVVDAGVVGDGRGSANATFIAKSESSYCIRTRLVGSGKGGQNLYYRAANAPLAGIVINESLPQSASGAGWINDPEGGLGSLAFDINLDESDHPQGHFVYLFRGLYQGVLSDFIIQSTTLSSLNISTNNKKSTATLHGQAMLMVVKVNDGSVLEKGISGNLSVTITHNDQGSEVKNEIALGMKDANDVVIKTVPATALLNGNILIQRK